jgi:hypothetical protein
METKWTKGPWKLKRDPSHFDSLSSVYAGEQNVAEIAGTFDEQEPNAHLIAASPELYTAHVLRDAFEYWSFGPQNGEEMEQDKAWNDMCDLCILHGMDPKQKNDPDCENHPSKFIEDYVARAMAKARGELEKS